MTISTEIYFALDAIQTVVPKACISRARGDDLIEIILDSVVCRVEVQSGSDGVVRYAGVFDEREDGEGGGWIFSTTVGLPTENPLQAAIDSLGMKAFHEGEITSVEGPARDPAKPVSEIEALVWISHDQGADFVRVLGPFTMEDGMAKVCVLLDRTPDPQDAEDKGGETEALFFVYPALAEKDATPGDEVEHYPDHLPGLAGEWM